MVEGEDPLFRPVGRFYPATALIDPSSGVDLAFVMLCNEAMDVEIENNARAWAAEAEARKTRR